MSLVLKGPATGQLVMRHDEVKVKVCVCVCVGWMLYSRKKGGLSIQGIYIVI